MQVEITEAVCNGISAFLVKPFAKRTFNMILFECRNTQQAVKNMEIIGIE